MSFFGLETAVKYPIILDLVRDSNQMKVFVDTINKYHSYKKFTHSPTRNLRWNVYETESGNLIGAIGLSSCVLALKNRDEYIGWDKEHRLRNINLVANNSRFCLIQDNFTVENAGSMVLKSLSYEGRKMWKERYEDDLLLLETFVEPNKNRAGAVYKASNWIELDGMTAGNSIRKGPLLLWKKETGERGKLARENPQAALEKYGYGGKEYVIEKSKPKMVFLKPLSKDWKLKLNS